MTLEEIAEAVVAWARELIPELKAGYSYAAGVTDLLPDVAAAIAATKDVPSDSENFPMLNLEQTWLRVCEVELSIVVRVEKDGDEWLEETAQRELEGFTETLMGSTSSVASLDDRAMISPRVEADLKEPAEQRPDGTRGRAMYMTLFVAQPLEGRLWSR